MLKRALMIGLAAGIGLATLHAVSAEAGWSYVRPPGMWWYYGSLNGCGIIDKVRSTSQHPARLSCDVRVTEVESLCKNPSGKDVLPGESATQLIYSKANNIDPSELLSGKNKGKANVCVELNNVNVDCTQPGQKDNALCSSEYCVNPNWNPWYVIVSEFVGDCKTEYCSSREVDENTGDCIDGSWVQADTQLCECSLPVHAWPPTEGTPYECLEVVEDSSGALIYTGEVCQAP